MALATCFSLVVSTVASTGVRFETGGSSTFGWAGSAWFGSGTGASEGSGTLGAALVGFSETGADLAAVAEGFGGRATLEEAAVPLASVGTGRAWPATSSAASSSSAIANSESWFDSGWAKKDSRPCKYRVTSPLPPVAKATARSFRIFIGSAKAVSFARSSALIEFDAPERLPEESGKPM